MPTLQQLCTIVEQSEPGATPSPLLQACAMPRSSVDLTPLPEPHGEAPFDSSWDMLLGSVADRVEVTSLAG